MASKLYNLARMTTATTGTGTLTLGSAVAGFMSFAASGITDGLTVTYAIKDGSNSEIGRGVYTASGTTLTRTVLKSTNSNNAISLSGSAVVFVTAAAEDILEPPASSVDNAAVRFDGTSGKEAQGSALLIADTTGALSRSGDGGIPVQGTNTNDSASSGYVGEFISSTVASGSPVSLTDTVAANVTSISLTAGDWLISGLTVTLPHASTTQSANYGWVSTVSATTPTPPHSGGISAALYSAPAGNSVYVTVPAHRISLASTTTVYLGCLSVFAVSTNTAYGWIGARRIR